MAKRTCAYDGEDITGYPHITVWNEQADKSTGIRFHNLSEMVSYFWLLWKYGLIDLIWE